MSYEPDFVKEMQGVFTGLIIFGSVMFALSVLRRVDRELKIALSGKGYALLLTVSISGTALILHGQPGEEAISIRGVVMLIYLILCSVTDYYTQQVYDLIQLGVCIVIAAYVLQLPVSPVQGAELIVFGLLQGVLFRKMYGEADIMCFLLCALSMAERGIFIWTCHMGISFLLLGVMQGVKGNIAGDGNLKTPVAFFPYMAVAYVLVFSESGVVPLEVFCYHK